MSHPFDELYHDGESWKCLITTSLFWDEEVTLYIDMPSDRPPSQRERAFFDEFLCAVRDRLPELQDRILRNYNDTRSELIEEVAEDIDDPKSADALFPHLERFDDLKSFFRPCDISIPEQIGDNIGCMGLAMNALEQPDILLELELRCPPSD